ncbi:MAG: hypothetical protein DDT32_01221 [Syntrophomonadaceae bacterium]|nr:hypothetical protein [Bacillota bacterium]MBT9147464.1 hypothetical protein [Bacillota bacterium]
MISEKESPAFRHGENVKVQKDSAHYWRCIESKRTPNRTPAGQKGGKEMAVELTSPTQSEKYPKRGQYCQYTEDCLWGADGWCDRPRGWNCSQQEQE